MHRPKCGTDEREWRVARNLRRTWPSAGNDTVTGPGWGHVPVPAVHRRESSPFAHPPAAQRRLQVAHAGLPGSPVLHLACTGNSGRFLAFPRGVPRPSPMWEAATGPPCIWPACSGRPLMATVACGAAQFAPAPMVTVLHVGWGYRPRQEAEACRMHALQGPQCLACVHLICRPTVRCCVRRVCCVYLCDLVCATRSASNGHASCRHRVRPTHHTGAHQVTTSPSITTNSRVSLSSNMLHAAEP